MTTTMYLNFHIIASHQDQRLSMPAGGVYVGMDMGGLQLFLNAAPFAEAAFRLFVEKGQLQAEPTSGGVEVLLNGRELDCVGILADRSRITLRGGSFLFHTNVEHPDTVDIYVEQEQSDEGADVPEDECETAMTVMVDNEIKQLLAERAADTDAKKAPYGIPSMPVGDLPEGTRLGKYNLRRKIGKGGMGVVYLAHHEGLGILRVLKMLSPALEGDDPLFRERFVREARMAAKIRHPNVVEVLDLEHDDSLNIDYIVMEYMDGGTLRKLLKGQGRLEEELAFVILFGITEALVAAATAGIVHRDIKPDNIMFTLQGEVKLADLGIGKSREEDTHLTKNEAMLGTPAYLPPEQVENPRDVDCRADLYSLGVTVFEMVTGHTPYAAKTVYDTLHKLFYDPVPDPREENPQLTEWFAQVIVKLMAKDPGERFQTPGELLAVLSNGPYLTGVSERMTVVGKVLESIQGMDTLSGGSTSSILDRSVFLSGLHRTNASASGQGGLSGTMAGDIMAWRKSRARHVLISSLLGVLFPIALILAGLVSWQWHRELEKVDSLERQIFDQEKTIAEQKNAIAEQVNSPAAQELAEQLRILLIRLDVWDGNGDLMAVLTEKTNAAATRIREFMDAQTEHERGRSDIAWALGLPPAASQKEIRDQIDSLRKASAGTVNEQVADLRGQLQVLLGGLGLWEPGFAASGVPAFAITNANQKIESALEEHRAIAKYLGLDDTASLERIKEEIAAQKGRIDEAVRAEWRPLFDELELANSATIAEVKGKVHALSELPQTIEKERLHQLVETYSLPPETATVEEAIEYIVRSMALEDSAEAMKKLLAQLTEKLNKASQTPNALPPIAAPELAKLFVAFVVQNCADDKAITMLEQSLNFFFVGIQATPNYMISFGRAVDQQKKNLAVTEWQEAVFQRLHDALGITVAW